MAAASVEFIGLKEVARGFHNLDAQTRKVLPVKLKAVAEIVASSAARKVPSKTGNAIASIKSISTPTSAAVSEGGSEAPYVPWLDFGSRTPRTGNTRAEGPWRGSGAGPKDGRFIYPAIKENEAAIGVAVLAAVEQAAKEVGFK